MTVNMSMRVGESELLSWKAAAERLGAQIGVKISLASWIRSRLNEAAQVVPPTPKKGPSKASR
jgi:hypothetical protein